MLEGAFTSPKIRRLAAILEIPWPHAVGLSGLLWRFAAKHAPTGAVGRHEDEDIATALEWPGTAQGLTEAFVRCRLLDAVDGPDRLLIHDWPDHCPRHVRATLQRTNRDFAPHYGITTVPTTVRTTESTADGTIEVTTSTSSSSSAFTSTSTSSNTSTVSAAMSSLAVGIWKRYVPGRKIGKKVGVEAIVRSIGRIKRELKCDNGQAADYIRERVEEQVIDYKKKLEAGEIEAKYIPTGITYFRQERWNDDDEREPTADELRKRRIAEEIRTARNSNLG